MAEVGVWTVRAEGGGRQRVGLKKNKAGCLGRGSHGGAGDVKDQPHFAGRRGDEEQFERVK